jgi:hypothetical protein
MVDIAHLLRPAHLQSLSNILKDPEASENDRFVALELLKNANIASAMVLPMCQVVVKKGGGPSKRYVGRGHHHQRDKESEKASSFFSSPSPVLFRTLARLL